MKEAGYAYEWSRTEKMNYFKLKKTLRNEGRLRAGWWCTGQKLYLLHIIYNSGRLDCIIYIFDLNTTISSDVKHDYTMS